MFQAELTVKMQLEEARVRYLRKLAAFTSEVSGALPVLNGSCALDRISICKYCDRPNITNSETCNGCGAPAKAITQL